MKEEIFISDYDLIQNCLKGEQDSFAELVARYKRLIYSVVCKFIADREEADDVSQEIFLRIYKSLGSYNPQYKFSTWSVKIATNMCLDVLRKKKINSVPMEEIEAITSDEDTPEKRFISREKSREIQKAIDSLPEKYRTPIILYHHKGVSYKEMTQMLKQPMSVIKNRIYRARLMLRDSLLSSQANY